MSSSEEVFDLFDQEKDQVRRAMALLEQPHLGFQDLKDLALELAQALEQSSREQQRLVRTGDRQQAQLRMVSQELQEKSRLLEEQARHLMVLNTELAHEVETRKSLEVELRVQATTDPLTGAYNRRRFSELADYELAREQRNREGLCLVALDIDHFKRVNDRHGHAAGDGTLLRFTQSVTTALRGMDTLGRLGGEEFAILLPSTLLKDALNLAERIRQAVERCPMSGPEGPFFITVSLGVTQLRPGEGLEGLMSRADGCLYEAKRTGRNRVASRP
nr:GGDEF domain-containing protein [uncultured Holophaga sp.]